MFRASSHTLVLLTWSAGRDSGTVWSVVRMVEDIMLYSSRDLAESY